MNDRNWELDKMTSKWDVEVVLPISGPVNRIHITTEKSVSVKRLIETNGFLDAYAKYSVDP